MNKKIIHKIFISILVLAIFFLITYFLFALGTSIRLSDIQSQSGQGANGQVSFNGMAMTKKCFSATNLGEQVMPADMEFKKVVCTTNPGNAPDSCFFERVGAKEPVESGDQLISTGQNNGGDKKYTLTNSYTGESKSEDAKSAKQEMETRQPKSCCIKAAQTQIGIICVTTIGQPVKQFGELKGGRNFGHKSRPAPTTPSPGFIQKLNAVINF
jgi:hypothetical protein